jgi:predicted ATP-grasp superfamily ATP-dependent carboligase
MIFSFENLGFYFNCNHNEKSNLKIAKVDTQEKTLLVGFPSNGLVGTFSISYLIHHLKMKQIGEIEVPDLPLTLFVEGGELLAPIRVYNKNNIYIIISDVPFNQYLAEGFALAVHEFCKKNAIKKIMIVSGMETVNKEKDAPKIYGLVTHSILDNILYNNQIPKFLDGSIFGTDAAIMSVFRKTKIPALVLYAECHPFFPDPEASIVAIVTLAKILDIKVDTKDIQNRIEKLRIQHRKLMEETIRALQQQQGKDTRAPQIYR